MKRYFYTTDYPHRWTSGRNTWFHNEDWTEIKSLEDAKALAEKHRHESYDESRCETTYGVMDEYKVD